MRRRPQRCWKEQRRTRYHRIAGWTPKRVRQWFEECAANHEKIRRWRAETRT